MARGRPSKREREARQRQLDRELHRELRRLREVEQKRSRADDNSDNAIA